MDDIGSGCVLDPDYVAHVHMHGRMDSSGAIAMSSALAQTARLEVFKLLVRREFHGLPAGEIARKLGTPHNTMSAHLGILSRAGLIVGERHSRSIIYRANLDQLREVTLYLVKDCCGGRPELCDPLIADLSCCATVFPEIV